MNVWALLPICDIITINMMFHNQNADEQEVKICLTINWVLLILARTEEKISKQKAIEMFENGFLEKLEPGTYESLVAIHKYLFDEIYDFAVKFAR